MVNADKEFNENKFAHLKSGIPSSDSLEFVVKTVKLGKVVTPVHRLLDLFYKQAGNEIYLDNCVTV